MCWLSLGVQDSLALGKEWRIGLEPQIAQEMVQQTKLRIGVSRVTRRLSKSSGHMCIEGKCNDQEHRTSGDPTYMPGEWNVLKVDQGQNQG